MKTNNTVINSIMKNVYKYICLVLMLIGTSASAWATTETMDFTQCWGIGTTYDEGVYTYNGYAIEAHHAKYNQYNDYWILNYYYSDVSDHNGWGGIILPPFNGTVSSISVTSGSGSGATVRYIDLYVNGTKQASSTGIAAGGTYTFTSLSIAAGSTIELRNNTVNNEFHLASLSITHNGSQMGTAAVSGKSVVSASADGNGTVTVSSNPVSFDATTTLTAVPASGWQFDYWEVTSVTNTCTAYTPFSTRTTQNEFTADNIIGLTTDASIELYNFTYPDYFIAVAHFVETTCTIETTTTFATTGTKNVNASTSSQTVNNAATATRTIGGSATGQSITYTCSNPSLTINSSTGAVTVPANFIGSATITATAVENGDYCESSSSYTLNVNGYTVTYHYPSSCSASTPANVGAPGVIGSHSLPTNMGVDGYQFVGWTTNSGFSDGSSAPDPLYTSSVTVTSNIDLYAAYKKVSSKFVKMAANTTLTAGDYVICTNYTGTAVVMTNNLDGNYRMTTNNSDYTFDGNGDLSCNDEECIWNISGSTGNWVLYNAASSKYLSANNGSTGSSDRQMRLADNSSTNFEKWIIAQKDASTVPYQIRNKGRVAANASDYGINVNSGKIGWLNNQTGSFYLFKRTSTSNAYTINPDCDAAEYTVTFNLASAPTGTTVTASATGATFSSPVLSPVTSGTSVTIGATAGTGYHFDHWTVTSGGASLSSSASTASNGFTMPASNVVLTPVFAPDSYTITYLDKGGSAFSGTHNVGYPTTHTYGTATTLYGATKDSWEFAGWYTTSACTSGTQVTSLGATDHTGTITLYALWVHFTDPLAWCPEPEVHLTGDNVYVTSTQGKMITAAAQLTLNARNLAISGVVRLTTPSGSGVSFSTSRVKYNATSTTLDVTADGGDITDQTIYVHYSPTAAGTGAPADILVRAEYQTNTDYYSTCAVHVRNMPSSFAIAVKQGNSWYALPANMSGATNPSGVLLNVDESTWTAKGPSTLSYELWPVKSTTGSADLYATKGEKIRFSGNSNKGLWASTSTNTLNNNAGISAITSTPESGYEWNITTAVDGSTWKYTLQMQGNSNLLHYYNSSVWGSYASGISDIYLIPLTPVETASISPMEWGESEIAIKCAANTTLSKVTIDGAEVSPKPSLTSLGGDIYKIHGGGMPNLSTLATYAMKTMVIEVSESSTDKQIVLTIPFILTSTNSPAATPLTAVNLRNLAGGSSQDARNTAIGGVDVVVRNGAQLDVTNDESTYCTFKDLYIYPGGKVHIDTKDLGAKNVYMRGGFSWLDVSKDYRLPQMLVESGKKIEGIGTAGHGVYYDLYLDNAMYYMTAFPKDVLLSTVTNEEGTEDWTGWVKGYSGEGRTLNPKESGWKYAWEISPGTTLYRGRGYEIAIKPRYKGAMNGRTIGILRFPLLQATAWSDEATPDITVTAWGVDNANVTANNKGWNYIGNPFFSSFRNTDANGQFGANMEIRNLQEHIENGQWNGKYDWVTDATVKYITVPDKMVENYTDVKAKNYEIEAFFPFFLQASATGSLTFTGSKILKAKGLFSANTVPAREVEIDFTLSDQNGKTDNAGLIVSDDYSAEFDMDDKEKTIVNENFLKVYTMVGEYRTAFNSLPEMAAALPIPVGYIAPQEGMYEFSLDEGDYSEIEHVWLTDREEQITVDLLDGSYEFQTGKGANDTRLELNVILSPKKEDVTTGTDIINTEDKTPLKFLHEDKMFIRYNGIIYDATGKRVK